MLNATVRNTAMIGALAIGATVSGYAATWVMTGRGALGPGVLDAVHMPGAIAAAIIALVICTVLAIIVGRVSNTAVGLFTLGGGLFGLAWRTETVEELVLSGSPWSMVFETAGWGVLALLATLVVFKCSGPLRDIEPPEGKGPPHPVVSAAALRSALAGILVLPVVWFLAQSTAKGQVIGAVFFGAVVAGIGARLLAPHVQPVLIFATPVLFGAIGQAASLMMMKTGLDEALVRNAIPHLLRPMGVDYVAGSFMGVAFGLGWAKSFLHHEEDAKEKSDAREPAAAGS